MKRLATAMLCVLSFSGCALFREKEPVRITEVQTVEIRPPEQLVRCPEIPEPPDLPGLPPLPPELRQPIRVRDGIVGRYTAELIGTLGTYQSNCRAQRRLFGFDATKPATPPSAEPPAPSPQPPVARP